MGWDCIACGKDIDTENTDDWAVCKSCLELNDEELKISENVEQFIKEFHRLFYADTWEHWYVSVKEFNFFINRWGMRSE